MQNELIAERYRISRPIGRGGMGTVWLCRDEVLDRDVAIKQIGALPGEEGDGAARARREARLAASLNHPNAVSIYDVIEHEGKPWLVMEYVPAKNLSQIIKARGTLPPDEVAAIAAQIAKALAAAHKLGVVHRDVKPSNILVDDFGIAKITDFGIAKANTDPQLTRTGMMAGTPAYFSPELARGRTPSPSSDVWALGATIFHALEGQPPYGLDENTIAMLYRIGVDEPARAQNAGALGPALSHLLDTDVERRWSMAMAADKLAELANPRGNISMSEATSASPTVLEQQPGLTGPGTGAPLTGPIPGSYPATGASYPATGPGYPATGASYPATGPGYPATGASYPATGASYAPGTGATSYGGYPPGYPPTGSQLTPSGPPSYGAIPVEPPRKKPTALIAAVATVAAIVIGLALVLLLRDKGNGSEASGETTSTQATESDGAESSPAPESSAAPEGGESATGQPASTQQPTTAAPPPAPAPTTAAPQPTTTNAPTQGDSSTDAAEMVSAVEQYYDLLPDDPNAAYENYLTGGIKKNFDAYIEFWAQVISVSCTDVQANTANSTVTMYCVYDMPTEIVEHPQTATMTKLDNGLWYISGMSTGTPVTTPK